MSLDEIRSFDDVSTTQWRAVGTKLGGVEGVKRLLRDDVRVKFVGDVTRVIPNPKPLFGCTGRRIPVNLVSSQRDSNWDFHLQQPLLGHVVPRLERAKKYLGLGLDVALDEFVSRTNAVLDRIQQDRQLGNLLNAVHLPVYIPQLEGNDYGTSLEPLVESAGKSYEEQFPERKFNNYRRGGLANLVTIVPGSRHERLVEALGNGPVVGIYFPNPLQGFSIDAQRGQMKTLPDDVLLAGGFESAAAVAMYPDVLCRDYQTPGLDVSALTWQSREHSLCWEAIDDELFFDNKANLGAAHGNYSGGLFLLG